MNYLEHAKKITQNNVSKIDTDCFKGTLEAIVRYALSKKTAVYQLFEDRIYFVLKRGSRAVWIKRALSSRANPLALEICHNKNLTKEFVERLGYPVPAGIMVKTPGDLKKVTKTIKFPAVVKPLRSFGGKGVTANIRSKRLLLDSFNFAKKYGQRVLIENHIPGDYHRMTYVADGSFAVTRNMPAIIVGDGKKTVRELILFENKRRSKIVNGRLKQIVISEKTTRFLAAEGLSMSSVVAKNRTVPLCFSGYDGGEYIDVTESTHPSFVRLGRDLTRSLGLPIVGIDIVAKDISRPIKGNGFLIEINASAPDISFHGRPTQGKARNLAPYLVEYLFKLEKNKPRK